MATERTVLVRLKANPNDFVRGMATATAAVNGLRKEIDTTNDRTAWMAQSILALGPAMVPLGAAVTPVLSGIVTQMGAVASAAGVAALAFTGVGDAIKTLNDYQLDPTTENFDKMRDAMQEIGPDGAEFVRFLDDIGPRFDKLQMTAREGFFPGAQEGIEEFMTLLPQVNRIVGEIAEGMGQLSTEAGQGLAGQKFKDFFDWLESDAKPILLDFGRTLGNFAEGFANALVAFSPLSSDFSNGLLEMSRDFAEWSRSLETNTAFQDFVDYVREAGPRALDFLGSFVNALVQIVEAAAPVGDVMLPALSAVLDVIAQLADSPIGPLFIGAAAAMSLYGRAAALASITTSGLGKALLTGLGPSAIGPAVAGLTTVTTAQQRATMSATALAQAEQKRAAASRAGIAAAGRTAGAVAGMALAFSDLDDKAGVANTTMGATFGLMAGGLPGLAAGAVVGSVLDIKSAIDDLQSSVSDLDEVLAELGSSTNRADVKQSIDETTASLNEIRDIDWTSPTAQLDAYKYVWGEVSGSSQEAVDTINNAYRELNDPSRDLGNNLQAVGREITESLDPTGRMTKKFDAAAVAVDKFAKSLSDLNDVLESRASLRDYEAALDDLRKALGDKGAFDIDTEKGRAQLEKLDAVASAAVTRAQQLKEAGRDLAAQRMLERALADLEAFGRKSKDAKDAMQPLIDELRRLNNTNAEPRIDANDDPFRRKLLAAERALERLSSKTYSAVIELHTVRSGAGGQGRGYDGYAAGGFVGDTANAHPPMIAAGAAPVRVWAEPETKGESYIPHANDWRRPRAKSILEQTASLFGGAVQWNAAGSFAPARGTSSGGAAGLSDGDIDRLANAMSRVRSVYGDVTVVGDDSFRKQLLADQQAAAMGGF